MALYLRKSFKAGPVRFNLSKSGVGVSAGVTGARVGLSADGRVYTHAGRHGLYARDTIGHIGGGSRGQEGAQPRSGPIVLEEDTGVTFGRPPSAPQPSLAETLSRSRSTFVGVSVFIIIVGLVVALLAYGGRTGDDALVGWAFSGGFLALGVICAIVAGLQQRALRRLDRAVSEAVELKRPLRSEMLSLIKERLRDKALAESDKEYATRLVYLVALSLVMQDQRVDSDELEYLSQLESLFEIPGEFIAQARIEAFRREYLEAVSDRELTEDEELILGHIRQRLGVPDAAIREELEFLGELREVRAIAESDLPVVETTVKLRKNEICHYHGRGRFLKSKIQRSFQRNGQKYQIRGLEMDKEGELLVTNQRLLLVHSGTTSIPIAKILDVEVDWDLKLLTLTKDGAVKPVLLTTPDTGLVGSIISRL